MSIIPIKRTKNNKSLYDLEVDKANPLSKGLVICVFPVMAGKPINIADKQNSTGGGGFEDSRTAKGWAKSKTSLNTSGFSFNNPRTGSSDRTLLVGSYRVNDEAGNHIATSGRAGTGERWTFRYSTANVLRVEIDGSGYTGSTTVPLNSFNVIGLRLKGSTLAGHDLFLNGSFESASGAGSVSTSSDVYTLYGNAVTASSGAQDEFVWMMHWDRALLDYEIRAIQFNPYQVLRPRMNYINILDAAPSGISIPVFMSHYRNQGIA